MKTALVLSGGGMFGAYQAGAWKALSREFAPDMVVGVSVGALNGWYIASGASADDLERHWLDPVSAGLMAYRTPLLPWSIFDPRPLEMRAKFLVENYKPRVDFGVVLLQLPRLQPKLVRDGEIGWRHLVATCSIPAVFPPVRIGGAFYCDGGLLEPTPIWAAAAMGATRVVAVNCSRFIPPWVVGMMMKGVCRWSRNSAPAASGVEVVMISPKDPFGRMYEGAVWRQENIERWIEMGETDAITALRAVTS